MGVVQMNSNPLAKDFNTGSLLKFAFPTISMMLFMGLYTIVDTIFVSRFVNTNALSAINIVCPVINLIVGLGTMIAMVIFDMGIAGAGFGTGIGYLIPAITGLIVFCKKSGTLSFVKPIIDIKVLGESCINGSSEMVSQLSTAITTFFFNRTMMNLLGVNGVASITIIIYTQFLLTTLFIGFSMGVAPVISYNFGANNYYGLKKIYKICISFIFVGSLFIFALSFINGNTLVRLFTGTNEAVYKIAINGFMIFVFSFLFSGFNIFSSAIFTALSNGKLSALISFLRTFGFIMIGLLIMPQFIGITGVWLAVPIAEILTLCISLYLNFRLWLSWNNQNNSYEKNTERLL